MSGPSPRHGRRAHKAERLRMAGALRRQGALPCAYAHLGNPRCAGTIVWGVTPWDLAHDDDRPGRYLALPACRPCNRGKFRRHGRKGGRANPRAAPQPADRETRRRRTIDDRERARRRRRAPARMILPADRRPPGQR